ncbi:MAG TPA: MBL fold metallo-hydrolase [Acidobacteriota bacterium]|nr:MBL fold metallo-hydrolase [Acidobacteriota bacterium]
MRKYQIIAAAITVCLLATAPTWAQERDFSQIEFEATHVAGNIHMLVAQGGGNIGVTAGEDGIIIVDDQFAPLADKIRAALREINPGQLKFVLNTHWHWDHTDGNKEFGPEATVIAHHNVRRRLSSDQRVMGRNVEALPPEAWPVITFDESLAIHFNGETIEVIHLPHGHTDGDSVIYFTGSRVVHMGDHFFNGYFPFVDLESGGDVRGYAENVDRVLEMIPEDVKVIPGHGPLASKADLQRFHAMLLDTIATVQLHMSEGKTLEEIKEAGLDPRWESWGQGFINEANWITTIYTDLSDH